ARKRTCFRYTSGTKTRASPATTAAAVKKTAASHSRRSARTRRNMGSILPLQRGFKPDAFARMERRETHTSDAPPLQEHGERAHTIAHAKLAVEDDQAA